MGTPIQYVTEPYLLRSNVIFFHDRRYVQHGNIRWTTENGEKIKRYSDAPLPDIVRWGGADIPSGIRLRALPARKLEPFLRVDSPWEEHLHHPTVFRDGGVYRLWYDTRVFGCYAESDDGITWLKPSLGLQEFDGETANNIIFGKDPTPREGLPGGRLRVYKPVGSS